MFDKNENNTKVRLISEIEARLRERPLSTRELVLAIFPDPPDDPDARRKYIENKQRDVQRYLRELEDMGLDLRVNPSNSRQVFIPPPGRDGLLPLEALALHAATRMLYHHAPNRTYRKALERLVGFIPSRVRHVVNNSLADVSDRTREDIALEMAARAWFGGYRLGFTYKSANSKSGVAHENVMEVYFIEIHRSNLGVYVIGKEVAHHNKVITLKASRMIKPRVLEDQPYEIDPMFDPRAYLDGALGVVGRSDGRVVEVHLRFAPEAKERVLERDLANLEIGGELGDGRLEATLRAGVDKSGLPREALAFALSWGPRVEVIGPPEVRAHWLEEIRTAFERYESKEDC